MFFVFYSPNLFFKRVIILPKFGEIRSFVHACVVRASERPHVRAREKHSFCCFAASGRVFNIFERREQTSYRTNERNSNRTNERTAE
jgi:hypothetical protein